ncbi:TonB-dependent receptor [Pseudoalteromonas luteoviolacea]|uniref:TonB-dependent receptor n=1 Tax=Pseudoalteromonas luteoviolacea TaxID=43657 RepID=UPI001E43C448|nr:TonB-dependent receptor [Pseudoalteromonas luteoviolacea]
MITPSLASLILIQPTLAAAQIERIEISATKRQATVQETAIAVSAISGDKLAQSNTQELKELSNLSSSFNSSSSNSETGGTTLRIRGIGTTGDNLGMESSVGVFLDGIYLSRPSVALNDLMDVERIEVLRGPQGTVFGRNTSAGALSIVTKAPSVDGSEFWSNITLGNYNAKSLQMGGTFPVIEDELGIRLSYASRKRDGYTISQTSGSDNFTRDRYAFRSQLLWLVNDDIKVKFTADFANSEEQCCDAVILEESPLAASGVYALAGLPADGGVKSFGKNALKNRETNGSHSNNDAEQSGISSHLEWDLGWADFSVVMSYRDYKAHTKLDLDYVAMDVFNTFDPRNFNTFDTASIELRLQGQTDKLDWMIGTYMVDETIETAWTMQLGSDFSAYQNASLWYPMIIPELTAKFSEEQLRGFIVADDGTTLFDVISSADPAQTFAGELFAGSFASNDFEQQGKTFSLFTHNIYSVTNSLDLIAGFRWSKEQKEGRYMQSDSNSGACLNTAKKVGNQMLPSDFGNFAVAFSCVSYTIPADIEGALFPRTFDEFFEDENLTFALKAVYELNENKHVYGGYTRGYKSGGFNLDPSAAAAGADPSFDAETTHAFELGYKAYHFDDKLNLNIALFHQQLDDFQVLEFTGLQMKTFNVPTVYSSGLETELTFNASDDLQWHLATTLLDARYPDKCDGGNTQFEPVSRLCGNPLTNAPKFTAILGMNYKYALENTNLSYFVRSSLRYESKRRTSVQAYSQSGNFMPINQQEANTKANLSIGLSADDGGWEISIWANNLFDKQTSSMTFDVPLRMGATQSFIDAPRLWGTTLRIQY